MENKTKDDLKVKKLIDQLKGDGIEYHHGTCSVCGREHIIIAHFNYYYQEEFFIKKNLGTEVPFRICVNCIKEPYHKLNLIKIMNDRKGDEEYYEKIVMKRVRTILDISDIKNKAEHIGFDGLEKLDEELNRLKRRIRE